MSNPYQKNIPRVQPADEHRQEQRVKNTVAGAGGESNALSGQTTVTA
jgi:hypothetical protein